MNKYLYFVSTEKAELKKELEEEYKAEMEENDREMEEMKKAFEEKLAAARAGAGGVRTTYINSFIDVFSRKIN